MKGFNFKKMIIHDGSYHLDDLMCAIFAHIITNGECKIVRTHNLGGLLGYQKADGGDTIICDIGGGEFDHHQIDGEINKSAGTKFCAFGLLWKEFAKDFFHNYGIINDKAIEFGTKLFQDSFINEIDKTDNEGQKKWPSSLSYIISSVNNVGRSFDETFQMMKPLVECTLESLIKSVKDKEYVIKLASCSDGQTVLFNYGQFIPSFLFEGTTIKFVGSKSNRDDGSWNINCVPGSLIPASIEAGKNGCKFVHPTRFLAVFESEKAAEEAAHLLQ